MATRAAEQERQYGNRYFRSLTDRELFDWRPAADRGWFGWSGTTDCANVSAANREMRRRAKVAGLAGPYEWLATIAPITPPDTLTRSRCYIKRTQGIAMSEAWIEALEAPSAGMLLTVWQNLPTAYETDIEDADAVRLLLTAIAASIRSRLAGESDLIPTLSVA